MNTNLYDYLKSIVPLDGWDRVDNIMIYFGVTWRDLRSYNGQRERALINIHIKYAKLLTCYYLSSVYGVKKMLLKAVFSVHYIYKNKMKTRVDNMFKKAPFVERFYKEKILI